MIAKDAETLRDIRSESLEGLSSVIDTSRPVALLDIPNHQNVGDHMIVCGELEYLRKLGVDIAYVSDRRRFREQELRRRMPKGTILIHGGGNFGDIWVESQHFREALASMFPQYEIVQLPQSVFYRDPQKALGAGLSFGKHGAFTVIVRESESLDRCARLMPNVARRLIPDMALGWMPEIEAGELSHEILLLDRQDQEKSDELWIPNMAQFGQYRSTDWDFGSWLGAWYYGAQVPGEISRILNKDWVSRMLYPIRGMMTQYISQKYANNGVRLLHGSKLVVTNRLHAQILAILMDIPSISVDQEYGKIGSVYREYLHKFTKANHCENTEELAMMIQDDLVSSELLQKVGVL